MVLWRAETGRERRDYSDLRDSPGLGYLVLLYCCISVLSCVERRAWRRETEGTVADFIPTAEADGLKLPTTH